MRLTCAYLCYSFTALNTQITTELAYRIFTSVYKAAQTGKYMLTVKDEPNVKEGAISINEGKDFGRRPS